MYRRDALFRFKIFRPNSISHWPNYHFGPNFSFSHNNSSFEAQMAMEWSTRLSDIGEVYYYFSPSSAQFQSFRAITHSFITQIALKLCTQLWRTSFSFKVTWATEYRIWPRFRRFRTIAPVSIRRWLWKSMYCIKEYKRCFVIVGYHMFGDQPGSQLFDPSELTCFWPRYVLFYGLYYSKTRCFYPDIHTLSFGNTVFIKI